MRSSWRAVRWGRGGRSCWVTVRPGLARRRGTAFFCVDDGELVRGGRGRWTGPWDAQWWKAWYRGWGGGAGRNHDSLRYAAHACQAGCIHACANLERSSCQGTPRRVAGVRRGQLEGADAWVCVDGVACALPHTAAVQCARTFERASERPSASAIGSQHACTTRMGPGPVSNVPWSSRGLPPGERSISTQQRAATTAGATFKSPLALAPHLPRSQHFSQGPKMLCSCILPRAAPRRRLYVCCLTPHL